MKSKLYKFKFILKNIYIRIVDKLKNNAEISDKLFSIGNGKEKKFSRNKFDSYCKDKLLEINKLKKNGASISAIYRVKNGQEYIEAAILSVSPLVNEIIVVDNNSSDKTIEIVEKLKSELYSIVDIKIFTYSEDLELAGDGYIERVTSNPNGSLAKFYEYCFSLGSSEYLMKCDAHYIFTPKGINELRKAVNSKPNIVYFSGAEIFGKELDYEPSLFRKDSNYKFIDRDKWEQLTFPDLNGIYIYDPVFFHIKRLSFIKYINDNTGVDVIKLKYN
ncbi:TPA: glycosyltransferase [Photobacterium damselae]